MTVEAKNAAKDIYTLADRWFGDANPLRRENWRVEQAKRNYPRGCVDFSTLGRSGRRSMAVKTRATSTPSQYLPTQLLKRRFS